MPKVSANNPVPEDLDTADYVGLAGLDLTEWKITHIGRPRDGVLEPGGDFGREAIPGAIHLQNVRTGKKTICVHRAMHLVDNDPRIAHNTGEEGS